MDSHFDAFGKEIPSVSRPRLSSRESFRFLELDPHGSPGTRVSCKLSSNYSENRLLIVARSREGVSPEDADGSYL